MRVLFLSTGNAARSPIAEAVLLSLSNRQVDAQSAGVSPLKEIDPMARTAVRNVLNGRMEQQRPRAVDAYRDEHFDYVFTLSEEARDRCPIFANHPEHMYWPLEDPAATHARGNQRQHIFDRVTRELVRRLRVWWLRQQRTPPRKTEPLSQARRRSGPKAHWRTHPEVDAPLLAVAYFGPMRTCRNMCTLFERSGFQVVCGEKYGRAVEERHILPDGIVVRVDGAHQSNDELRPEFRAVQALQADRPEIPILVLVDHRPSDLEQVAMNNCGAPLVQRQRLKRGLLIEAMWRFVRHS
jgi:protein-tyrosine-phosphatase